MNNPNNGFTRQVRRWLLTIVSSVVCSVLLGTVASAQQYHSGKVVWMQLVTPDLAAAQRFYGGLFGWTFDVTRPGVYAVAQVDGEPIAGLLQPRAGTTTAGSRAGWLTFLSVRDVAHTLQSVQAQGGRLLSAPHRYPRGEMATFVDPQGVVFGVIARRGGDPEDALASPGEEIWATLITSDPDRGAAFYQNVFDYEVFDLPSDAALDGQHLVLSTEQFARASIDSLPVGHPDAHARWLDYIRVDDVTATAQRAQTLGGRLLVAPHPDRHGGQLAVIADPNGAVLGILEWSAAEKRAAEGGQETAP
jgi:uncharacterized protein